MNTKDLPLPYSVFTENRPKRIAFFINPNDKKAKDLVEAIIVYNSGKWGGRFNPIIYTDGKTISKSWWSFLKEYDPDVIKSYVPIEESLLIKIRNHLSPYLVEDYKPRNGSGPISVHLDNEGISVLPTKENIAQVTNFSFERTYLVLFEIDRYKKSSINSFLKINFGTYEPMLSTSGIIKQYPLRKEFIIKSKSELIKAISQLNTFDTFVYPNLLCAFSPSSLSSEHNYIEEGFNVVIGDKINDLVLYWNRIFNVSDFRQPRLNSIWISRKMAKDPKIIKGLNEWIKRAVDPGGSGDKNVRLISTSVKENELNDIANKLLENTFFRRSVTYFSSIQLPTQFNSKYLPRIKDRLTPIRVIGDEAHIIITPPRILEGSMGGEHWMVDIYVEFRPERFTYIHGIDYWWQLPPNNDLAMSIFDKPSRIASNGIPSVLFQRDTPFSNTVQNKLQIKLPEDRLVFQTLIVGDRGPIYTTDPRGKLAERPYYNAIRSDKGRYLSGLLDIFSGLHNAYTFFESRFWRRMFDALSHQNPQKDILRKQVIFNKLKKEIGRKKFDTTQGLEWLSEYILRSSKDEASKGKELTFATFEKESRKEIKEFNDKNSNNKFTYSEEDLKDDLAHLIELGIIQVGTKPRCPSCGLVSWYHVDEFKQIIECKGCGNLFGISPEETWYYRLNTLIQEGVARHYLIPVVLVLGQLLSDARSSFIATISLDIFNKNSSKPIGDLDIVCIQDGKFIIGEVKNRCSLFKEDDIKKMENIAKRLRPSKIIFSSLDLKPSNNVSKWMEELVKKLKKEEIDVEWFSLSSWIFEPKPL